MERVFNVLSKYFKFDKEGSEISIESDPNTFDLDNLNFYSENLPFNRITMGLQSLSESVFKNLNRSHTIQEALNSIEIIKQSSFRNNFGVDLIMGLPEQNLNHIQSDLYLLEKYDIPHMSFYMLTLELNSKLFKSYDKEYHSNIKQNEIAEMFDFTHNYLTSLKYEHYEISNFCKDKKYSVHNASYWDGYSQFYGFGNSSSSLISSLGTSNKLSNSTNRFKKPKSISKYYDYVNNLELNQKIFFENFLKSNNEMNEFTEDKFSEEYINLKFLILNQIRRREGINLTEIKNIYGDEYYDKIKIFLSQKVKDITYDSIIDHQVNINEYFRLKFPEGILVSDEIIVELFKYLEN